MQNSKDYDVPLPELPPQQSPGYGQPPGYQALSATTQNTTVVMVQPNIMV